MSLLRSIAGGLRSLFRKEQVSQELDEELNGFLEMAVEAKLKQGMSRKDALRAVRLERGNLEVTKEVVRSASWESFLEASWRDLRLAIRLLGRSPVFTVVAVMSLALGIGANTIIFSAVNQVLLRSLPYQQSERLFAVWGRSAPHGAEHMQVSAADFYDWRDQTRSFESLAAYASWPMNLTNVDEPRRVETELVSANLFSTLGVNAQIGRTFLLDEDQEQSPFVVVISHRLWRALGGLPQIVGRKVTLNGSEATVIGVLPNGFAFPSPEIDVWAPLSLSAKNRSNREGRWLTVIGRLRANSNQRDAATEMEVISRRLAVAYPTINSGWSASVVSLRDDLVGKTRPILLTVQAGTLLLLLVACANLANLLLAKGASRAREIGVRAALGASRLRILRQLIVESSVLATLGGVAGVALAIQGIRLLRTFGDGLIPRASEVHMTGSAAVFAVAATMITAVIFGLAPALHLSDLDLREQISFGARGTPPNAERQRGSLVAIEVGLASLLLVGAGLLGESLARLISTAPGLRTDHVLTLRLTLSRSQYLTNAAQNAFFEQILASVKILPGVIAAGEISDTPLKGNNPTFEFVVEGAARGPSDAPIQAGLRAISDGYLLATGIPVVKGRDFTTDDRADRLPVVIVNQTMARQNWPGSDPVGRRVRFKEDQRWMTVAGVVADIKHMGLKADEGPVVYIPYAQKTQEWLAWTTLLVRTAGEPIDLAPVVRSAIRSLDKNQPIAEVGTLEEVLTRSTALPRFTTAVIGSVSGFGLLIALVGVYGLLAYTVARRMPELGIRLTLGASPLHLSWLLIRQTMLQVFAGVAGGLLGAWWLARWLESQLFGVRPHDPTTFTRVAGLLILTSLAAVIVPVRRATKINPMTALRAE